MRVNVLLDLFSGIKKSLFACGCHILGVRDRDVLDLGLSDYAILDKEFSILEELIGDLVIALVEGAHKAGQDLDLLAPIIWDNEVLLN